MTDLARPFSEPDRALLDQLVPPPGPAWRRWAAWCIFVSLVAAVGWLAVAGRIVPSVEGLYPMTWGGTGPVFLGTRVTNNRGDVAFEIVDGTGDDFPGLDLIGYTVSRVGDDDATFQETFAEEADKDPFPIEIAPGESIVLVSWYDVTSCEPTVRGERGARPLELSARVADGPASWWTRTYTLDPIPSDIDTPNSAAGRDVLASYACP